MLSCFIAGTQVQYDLEGHQKNIEDFDIGDQIVSYNVKTGEYYLAEVYYVKRNAPSDNIYDVKLDNGTVLSMTENHPILTTDGFRALKHDNYGKLNLYDNVVTISGTSQIISISKHSPEKTYNLSIIDYTEYVDDNTNDTFVANGVIVHNY